MDMDFCYLQKAGKNLSNKYGQKLLDKTSTADAIKLLQKSNSKNSRSKW